MAKTKTEKVKTITRDKTKKELEADYYLENKMKTNNGELLMYVGHSDGLERIFNYRLNEAWLKKPHGETKVSTTIEVPVDEENAE